MTKKERLHYFRNHSVIHPILKETKDKLWNAIYGSAPGSIVSVIGPTGVGKTLLCNFVEQKIQQRYKVQLETDRERIPLVKVEAVSPPNGNFDWKNYFSDVLQELAEPAVDRKIDLDKLKMYSNTANDTRASLTKLDKVLVKAIKHRRPKTILTDEAQHFTAMSSGRKLLDQQNTIKSIANRTKTTYVLFGSYELMSLRNLNAQVSRRSVEIHFRRYNHEIPEDLKAFKGVLRQFQNYLPIEETVDLVSEWRFFYERSIGCIGVVKEWLNQALAMALEEDSNKLELRHLQSTALAPVKAIKLQEEIVDGEGKFSDEDNNCLNELRKALRLITIIKKSGQSKKVLSRKSRPFNRKAKRDKVGVK